MTLPPLWNDQTGVLTDGAHTAKTIQEAWNIFRSDQGHIPITVSDHKNTKSFTVRRGSRIYKLFHTWLKMTGSNLDDKMFRIENTPIIASEDTTYMDLHLNDKDTIYVYPKHNKTTDIANSSDDYHLVMYLAALHNITNKDSDIVRLQRFLAVFS